MRFRATNFNLRNEIALHNLQSDEIQFKVGIADELRDGDVDATKIAKLKAVESTFDRANRILAQANLPIRVKLDRSEIVIAQAGESYSFAKASDGERSALLLLSEVLTAPAGALFAIDEPERHLHRSIIVPLITTLIHERPDCLFAIATHELALPESSPDSQVVVVRSCVWGELSPSSWDLDILSPNAALSDEVRNDIIGSRRKILFVEGKSTSLDQPLYAILFPTVTVIAKEGCVEVRRSVEGLRSTSALHHVEGFGIVDNDNLTAAAIADSEANFVFPLEMYSVESLYYDQNVIAGVAARQASTIGGDSSAMHAEAIKNAVLGITNDQKDHLAARRAEKIARDNVLAQLPSRRTLIGTTSVTITINSSFAAERAQIDALIAGGDLSTLIDRYPLRETGALHAIAKALKFQSREDYEAAALKLIADNASIADAVRARLGSLASHLS